MTGTLSGAKCHQLVLEGIFGPVYKNVTTKELMEQKHLAPLTIKCLLLKHSDSVCQAAKRYTYQEEIEYLVLNEARNRFIANLALSLNGNTLLLYQYVEKHGQLLYDLLKDRKDRKTFFIHGKIETEAREEMRRILNAEPNAIVVGSYGTLSLGVDIPNLHNIIFASPSKSRIRNLQSIGRGLRNHDSKTHTTLFDIADDLRHKRKTNFTLKHFMERIKLYGEEKFDFKLYKIELKER